MYIRKIINYYSIFGAVNLTILIIIPLLTLDYRLPFYLWIPFDIYRSKYIFGTVYFYQFCCAIYAGGGNIAVNMYTYSMLVCLEFYIKLLSARLKRLGHDVRMVKNEKLGEKVSFYNETIRYVLLHLKIIKYDQKSLQS